jgi:hypothetical protein
MLNYKRGIIEEYKDNKNNKYLIIKENLGNCKYNLYNKFDFLVNLYGKFLLAS